MSIGNVKQITKSSWSKLLNVCHSFIDILFYKLLKEQIVNIYNKQYSLEFI